MPIAKSLKKVEQKLKKRSAVHPKARKFKQLNKASLREAKINKRKQEREMTRDAQVLRMKFIRAAVDRPQNMTKEVFTEDEIKIIIQEFISRDDAELEQLKSTRRPGRPASARQDALQTRRDFEVSEFSTGFYMPDLLDKQTVELFREWNLEHSGIGLLKFIRIAKEGGLQMPRQDDDMDRLA
ncbi:translation machinery-associated protein 16 [Lipomyces tetrasporus]